MSAARPARGPHRRAAPDDRRARVRALPLGHRPDYAGAAGRAVPLRQQRPRAFIYSDITALLAQARRLGPDPLRNLTYHTLIGLLAATGLRLGEAINLDLGDVDRDSAVLTIRESKVGKSRLVPVHETTTAALAAYAAVRDRGLVDLAGRLADRFAHLRGDQCAVVVAAGAQCLAGARSSSRRLASGVAVHDVAAACAAAIA